MSIRCFRRAVLYVLCHVMWLPAATSEPTNEQLDFFESRIRPVLVEHCYACHSAEAEEPQAGLRLDLRSGWAQGGDSGPAIQPQDPDGSLLLKAIRYEDDASPMPPERKLPDAVVQDFAQWIRDGAADPRTDDASSSPSKDTPSTSLAEDHWAFRAPTIVPPGPDPEMWSRNGLDRYVRDAQRQVGLEPSPSANRRTLIRRAYFDLWGIPPSYAETEAFVANPASSAFTQLIDQLLASPRFGERWARHWLDVSRFADTKGYVFQEDRNYPEAYRYRDWVIRALNEDLPYDEFLRYQLAADSIAQDRPEELVAMGYLTLGRRFLNNRHDIIDDRIDVVTRGLMALTVTCARCHDHKYDPIPMADYYSLYGVFASSDEPGGEPTALRLVDRAEPRNAHVFLRGNPQNRGPEVPRQFLELLSGPNRQPFHDGSGRREMAEAIASEDNPLTARVFVNRVWGILLGSYLVDTPSDFGTRSDPPLLLPVLDHLAIEFIRNDWSVKWLVREIVTSSTYQQGSCEKQAAIAIDPENRTYWRMNRRRLDFEALRDAVLAASGQLQAESVGGPSAPITGETYSRRRTLYAFLDRQNLPGLFRVFDVANPDTHSPKRFETTVPQQALFLMNSPFLLDQSQAAAVRALAEAAPDTAPRITALYRQILGRDPTSEEFELSSQFIGESPTQEIPESTPWSQLAQVLLLSNEFLFLD